MCWLLPTLLVLLPTASTAHGKEAARPPANGWYLGQPGGTCDQTCKEAHLPLVCNATLLNRVRTPKALQVVIGLAQQYGTHARISCPNGYEATPDLHDSPAVFAPWECLYTTNTNLSATTGASADPRLSRLCCCTGVGDDPVAVCPTTNSTLVLARYVRIDGDGYIPEHERTKATPACRGGIRSLD